MDFQNCVQLSRTFFASFSTMRQRKKNILLSWNFHQRSKPSQPERKAFYNARWRSKYYYYADKNRNANRIKLALSAWKYLKKWRFCQNIEQKVRMTKASCASFHFIFCGYFWINACYGKPIKVRVLSMFIVYTCLTTKSPQQQWESQERMTLFGVLQYLHFT